METITVHRAADLPGKPPVKSCTIVIDESVDGVLGRKPTMEEARLVYECEAEKIANALAAHLPQAVLDRIQLRLMQRSVERTYFKGSVASS